jgi:uncharacterized membrane protein
MQEPPERINQQPEEINKSAAHQAAPALASIPLRPLLMIASIFLVLISFSILKVDSPYPLWQPWTMMIIGLVLFLLTWVPSEKIGFLQGVEKAARLVQHKLGLLPLQQGLLLGTPLLVLLVRVGAGNDLQMRIPWLALGAWFTAIIFGVAGGWQRPARVWTREQYLRIGLWVLAFSVLGVTLRAVSMAHYPVNLTGDEASAGMFGVEFLEHKWNNIFRVGWYEFPSLYFLIPAGGVSIFGRTIEALRFPSALAGGLTVGMLYLLGRVFFNHRTGVIAAALLAASHFHVHFSRIGLNNIWDGLFFVMFIGLFWRAWQKEARNLYLWAGLVLGLSQYFYASARILLGLSLVWTLMLAVSAWPKFKRQLGSVLLMFWLMFLVFGPLILYMIETTHVFMAPFSRVMFTPEMASHMITETTPSIWQVYGMQFVKGLGAYSFVDTRHWYTPEVPILLYLEAGFFMLGVLLLGLRWRDARTWFLLSWLIAFGVMGAMSESAPASQRYAASVAGAALVAAYAMDQISTRFGSLWPGLPRWGLDSAVGLLVLASMLINLNFYFLEYSPKSYNRDFNTLVAQRLVNWLETKPGQWEVHFYGSPRMGYDSISSLRFLSTHVKGVDANYPWGDERNPQPAGDQVIFVFLTHLEEDLAAARLQYPNCTGHTEQLPELGVLFHAWECSPFSP